MSTRPALHAPHRLRPKEVWPRNRVSGSDDLWRWGIGEATKATEQREWGAVPYAVARASVECRRNRSDTRFHVPRLWGLWPLPLQQFEQDWDEVYADEFPEVSDSFACRGDVRWDTL